MSDAVAIHPRTGPARSGGSPLVLLKPGVEDPPLFILHGLGGLVGELSPLGRSIPGRHPVYAVEARGLDGAEDPFDTVEDMARHYLSAMRERQPHGPYLLVGYSFGGLVALEIAQLLMQAGELPALVVCLDTYIHPQYWPLATRLGVRRRRVANRLSTLARLPLSEIAAYIGRRATRGSVAGRSGSADRGRGDAPSRWFPVDPALPMQVQRVHRSSLAALARHRPRYYPGTVVFFNPRLNLNYPRNPTRMWRSLAEVFEVEEVAGDHRTMVGADCADLAARLGVRMREALAAACGS